MAGLGSFLQNKLGGSGINAPIVPDDKYLGKASLSRFGTWVYSDVILSLRPDIGSVDISGSVNVGGSTVSLGNQLATQIQRTANNISEENFLSGDPDSIRLQECILRVDLAKVMNMTTIAGRDDMVVEYLAKGSYKITANFNIASSWENVMPEAPIRKMIKILESKEPLTVSCRFLNFFNIDRIVILDYSMPQRAGYVNQQAGFFTAIAISNEDTIDAQIPTNNDTVLGH
ncbi:MAG: hypothetical protein JSS79_05260 [Bacteroidetes bacterium]|nr:hypothetical protein [Bacteroidota bacterium]